MMNENVKTTVLRVGDIRRIVRHLGLDLFMRQLIERLRLAIEQFDEKRLIAPARQGFQYNQPQVGLLEWMPLLESGARATIKVVGYHPENPRRYRRPTVISTLSLYDCASGRLLALADGTFLTALRTGAASALASRILASPQSATLGIIGCGAQSVTQVHALSSEFHFQRILYHDIDREAERTFEGRMAAFDLRGARIRRCSPDEIREEADIICTATSVGIGEGPVFNDGPTKPWLHINAVGSDFPGKAELPPGLLRRSLVCPDFSEQALREGECQQLLPEEIGPDLTELVRERQRYESYRSRATVFDSTGWAIEDHVALGFLLEQAEALGLGTALEIENLSGNPRNPYDFLTDAGTDAVAASGRTEPEAPHENHRIN